MNHETQIQDYLKQHERFKPLLEELRRIVNLLPFEETVKWGIPTYTYQKKNLVSIGAFKNHVGLWFFQGALLKDESKVLQNAQEGKTKAMRQIRFHKIEEIDASLIKAYLEETIGNQKAGLEVARTKHSSNLVLPTELLSFFKDNPVTETYFSGLSPGKQREYATYIDEAKRDQTKMDRLTKIKPLIHKGIGLYDNYKNC